MYALESEVVWLESFDGTGGAIERMGDDLLVATPKGRLALVLRDGTVEYLDGSVPMNRAALGEPEDYDPRFNPGAMRVADILLQELGDGRYQLFATHHYFTGDCIRLRLSSTTILRDEVSVTVLPEWRTILDAEPCVSYTWFYGHESGGKMLLDGADHLLVIFGHNGISLWLSWANFDTAIHLSKLLRVAIATGEVETLAIGFRNSQGLARDADGNLWATDHGPQGGDELNLLEPGVDYGWPQVSYGVNYGRRVLRTNEDGEVGRHEGFARPVFSWVPSPAISAIAVNDARHFPLWQDDLLVAALKDESLLRVRRNGTDVQYVERIEVGYRVRDVQFMPDGRIALLRDGGRVYFLSRSTMYCDEESRNRRDVYSVDCDAISPTPTPTPAPTPDARDSGTDTAAGKQLFGQQCSVCHSLDAEEHGPGPHLVGIIGRAPGAVSGYNFSAALRARDAAWTHDDIIQYLTNPEQFAPGTSMPSTGATETEARAIADYLNSLQ